MQPFFDQLESRDTPSQLGGPVLVSPMDPAAGPPPPPTIVAPPPGMTHPRTTDLSPN